MFWRVLISMLILAIAVPVGMAAGAVGDHDWSAGYAGAGELAVDGSGNVVIHGAFFSPVDFGGGTFNPVNIFDGDQYLARFDADGQHLWSLQFTPTGFGVNNEVVATDPAGNIYIAGRTFNGAAVDFGGGPVAENQIYVTKFNSSGVYQWSNSFGVGTVKAIAADNTNVVVTGYTDVGVDFGGGTIGAAGGNDAFVAQLTSAGAHVWSAGFGDAEDQGGMDVALDGSGNVVVVGSMFGTVDFGGGDLTANGLDLFLASFSPLGSPNWSQVFDGTFTPGGGILVQTALAASSTGLVAVVGEQRGSVDFGGGPLAEIGFGDAYIAVFNALGAHQWSAAYGSAASTENAHGVAFDASDNVMVAGKYGDDTDFGGGTLTHTGDPLFGDNNLFVAQFDPSGTHLFSRGYGLRVYDVGCRIGGGSMLVFGSGGASIDLGGGAITPFDLFLGRIDGNGSGGGTSAVGDLPLFGSSLRGFPNPFNPMTTVEYVLESAAVASVTVYDARGRLVDELVAARPHEAGSYQVRFTPAASGVYLVNLRVGGSNRILKMVAVK